MLDSATIARIKALMTVPHPVSGAWDDDNTLAAAQFNAEDIEHIKDSMSGEEVFAVTDTTEFGGLTEHKQQLWMAFCGRGSIDPEGAANVELVKWVFGEVSDTLTALADARKELISLAAQEHLGVVRSGYIKAARIVL